MKNGIQETQLPNVEPPRQTFEGFDKITYPIIPLEYQPQSNVPPKQISLRGILYPTPGDSYFPYSNIDEHNFLFSTLDYFLSLYPLKRPPSSPLKTFGNPCTLREQISQGNSAIYSKRKEICRKEDDVRECATLLAKLEAVFSYDSTMYLRKILDRMQTEQQWLEEDIRVLLQKLLPLQKQADLELRYLIRSQDDNSSNPSFIPNPSRSSRHRSRNLSQTRGLLPYSHSNTLS